MEHGSGPAWALAIEHSGLGRTMRESVWLYPAANVTHVLAMAVLLGAILVFDLRLLGAGRSIAADKLARLALPCAAAGVVVAIATGALLFAAEAGAYAQNPVFLAKMALVALGILNVAVFHVAGPARLVARGPTGALPRAARAAGAVSLAAWFAAAACGRLVAYF